MPYLRPPRLYSLFGKLTEDADDTIVLPDVPQVEINVAFREVCQNMRDYGFHVRTWADDCDMLPGCEVINPVSGKLECSYWVRETA
jgi:hypothetical protein